MPAIIIDGRKTRDSRLPELKEKIKSLNTVPTLGIIQVGDRPDSNSYIRAKQSFANKIGADVILMKLPENISEPDLVKTVQKMNEDSKIHGVIIQLPLPSGIDKEKVINFINPRKDADALTDQSVANWSKGKGIYPATARGVEELLSAYKISLKGKKVVVVGRSRLVGGPIAEMCRNKGANVTVCHSKTIDLKAETIKADIIIVAVGKPGLIGKENVKEGQIVIDVGTSKIDGENLTGDVDFESVSPIVAMISPVPGGVGPMTVLGLFENLVDLIEQIKG